MTRLDAALAAAGLARSRSHAQQLIREGLVRVNGSPILKAAHHVSDSDALSVDAQGHYVSRAAVKLTHALNAFAIDPSGRLALDAGASTGGFTQVLLERDARAVLALDVGHGQLDPSIRADKRVIVVEGENVRYLSAERTLELLAADSGLAPVLVPPGELPSLVVADLSFISLTLVLPALRASAHESADFVLLIKPQFEVGRSGVREGVVTSSDARADAINAVLWAAWDCGLKTAGLEPSPILGSHGNREFLVQLHAADGSSPTEWRRRVEEVAT